MSLRHRTVAALALLLLVAPLAIASHAIDNTYDQPVWFQWSETRLDVVIVPPEHGQVYNAGGVLGGAGASELNPYASSYLAAIEAGVANWQKAINTYAPTWLKGGIQISVYVLGRDAVPPGTDAEIIITTDQSKAVILGMAVSTNPCIVDNSKFFVTSFTYNDMYNINAHEYGHCLGLDHILDGHPTNDIMNGAYPYTPGGPAPKNCVSNLNVRGLEGVFARALGQPVTSWGKAGTVGVGQYQQTC